MTIKIISVKPEKDNLGKKLYVEMYEQDFVDLHTAVVAKLHDDLRDGQKEPVDERLELDREELKKGRDMIRG